jgi:MarR family transcriptional regulator, lower aerobic nicotinate degradation pathway regulator
MDKTLPISALTNHVGYWMRFVSNHVSHAFRLKVEARGVTVAEWVVLRALYGADGVNPSQLSETLGMTRGAISKLADRLLAKKLIKRTVDRGDRRFQSLTLTDSGRKLVPALAALADRNDAEYFGHLTAGQREELIDLLKNVVAQRGLRNVPVD